MAQRVQVRLVDHFNGEVAQQTVRFGLNGSDYEIGLTVDNASELRSAVAVGGRGRGPQGIWWSG